MLRLKPNCECCDADLWPDQPGAFICTFECTYCETCATGPLAGTCPACGGGLVARPVRPAALLARYPAQTERAPLKSGCPAPAAAA
jgi:uncharacterized protein